MIFRAANIHELNSFSFILVLFRVMEKDGHVILVIDANMFIRYL